MLLKLAEEVELMNAINGNLHLLKLWSPYSEADHVMNFAINALCEGRCLTPGATAAPRLEARAESVC
jgi:hypothetical protein